ncbi:MAG: response regulator [Blastochloris sp.]|nr:response regulator [Blastochloris sp.]
MLINLINNAEHAISLEGRSDGSISVEVEESAGHVQIQIVDNGIGMVREVRESIYDPFFTTKEVGKGTGLGLSIAQTIVSNHGGKITCSSGLHAGSVFTVLLPAIPKSPDTGTPTPDNPAPVSITASPRTPQPTRSTSTFSSTPPPSHSSAPRILVVDDEELIRSALARFLQSRNFQVTTAPDGLQALAIAHDITFDLVISDIRMPRMNGLEFYRGMLQVDRIYRDRFVFITGDLVSNDLITKVRESGCPLLEKPFNFELLSTLLPGALNSGVNA